MRRFVRPILICTAVELEAHALARALELLPLSSLPGLAFGAGDVRIAVKALLRSFTVDETAEYVQHRLNAAGATREIFTPDALEALHYLGHGVARQINRLGDLALLVGYADELPRLTAKQIEAVSEELVTIAAE